MAKSRNLLSVGNRKLGEAVFHFDVPAVTTCPGRTSACVAACYARKHRYRFDNVVDRLAWCYEQSQLPDFSSKVVREARHRGALHFRWHSSGDLYNADYGRKMLAVMSCLPRVTFWFYTRSYRVPDIMLVLEDIARLPNCTVYFSLDRETGMPDYLPPGVKTAYLQDTEACLPGVDLVFRTRRMISLPILGATNICPTDTPSGRKGDLNCGSCTRCFGR